MASKLSHLLRRHPVVLVVALAAVSLVAARFGHAPVTGLWDGPI